HGTVPRSHRGGHAPELLAGCAVSDRVRSRRPPDKACGRVERRRRLGRRIANEGAIIRAGLMDCEVRSRTSAGLNQVRLFALAGSTAQSQVDQPFSSVGLLEPARTMRFITGTRGGACAAALALVVVATPTIAQEPESGTIQALALGDLQTLEEKYTSLLEAMPDDKLDWTPAEGVRSPRAVFGHVAGA